LRKTLLLATRFGPGAPVWFVCTEGAVGSLPTWSHDHLLVGWLVAGIEVM